jgi:tetratricopeptide (TPR) repeat protein
LNEAIQAYRTATQADPAYFDAYYNLGLVAAKAGNVQLALQAYESALAVRPKALDARYNFALLLRQAGFPQDAANEHQTILKDYPNESRAHLALGNLYAQQLNQPAKAKFHYQKVLETDPRNPQAAAIRYWLTSN